MNVNCWSRGVEEEIGRIGGLNLIKRFQFPNVFRFLTDVRNRKSSVSWLLTTEIWRELFLFGIARGKFVVVEVDFTCRLKLKQARMSRFASLLEWKARTQVHIRVREDSRWYSYCSANPHDVFDVVKEFEEGLC